MATSSTYYVNEKNELNELEGGNTSNAISSGKAKYCIEVFGGNHEHVARGIKKLIEDNGLEGAFYTIKVGTNDETPFLPASDALLNTALHKMGWPTGDVGKMTVKLLEMKRPGHLEKVFEQFEELTDEEKQAVRKCSKESW